MKNYDILFILGCFFVIRLIAFSGSYPDALCLIAILAYKIAKEVLDQKKLSSQVMEIINKNERENAIKMQAIADELVKVKNANEGIKAAINFAKR